MTYIVVRQISLDQVVQLTSTPSPSIGFCLSLAISFNFFRPSSLFFSVWLIGFQSYICFKSCRITCSVQYRHILETCYFWSRKDLLFFIMCYFTEFVSWQSVKMSFSSSWRCHLGVNILFLFLIVLVWVLITAKCCYFAKKVVPSAYFTSKNSPGFLLCLLLAYVTVKLFDDIYFTVTFKNEIYECAQFYLNLLILLHSQFSVVLRRCDLADSFSKHTKLPINATCEDLHVLVYAEQSFSSKASFATLTATSPTDIDLT